MNIGINGLGRIGKCVLLQLLQNPKYKIRCINAINITVYEIEEYLKYDSSHHYDKNFYFKIISNDEFILGTNRIKLFSDRNAVSLKWKDYNCNYLIDCTGSYLTTDKCKLHDVEYIIISSPAKDNNIPTFIYGVNDKEYDGQNIVSGSSCTTNCISPLLKILNDNYKIKDCVFTTIHATTASQYTVDIIDKKQRTSRSILNNIIPHTTGASSSIYKVIPELNGLINGTSLRVPVLNCSLVDVNIYLEDNTVKLDDIIKLIRNDKNFKVVYDINNKNLVSCDFMTTTTPTIIDINASIDMGNGRFKFMVWYDNEWSYSAQLIRLFETMYNNNTTIKSKYYITSLKDKITDKRVMLRLDLNVPINNNIVTDDFRISSSIPTINTILEYKPKCIILSSHFGRPVSKDTENSLLNIINYINQYLNYEIVFLDDGISNKSLEIINNNDTFKIYLLENLRFHSEETNYLNIDITSNNIFKIYNNMADIFICDAFGCVHREHMSICGPSKFNKQIGYGHLIAKEIDSVNKLTDSNKKILCIIGGNKIKDKMPIIDMFTNVKNAKIFVAGGIAKHYRSINNNTYIMKDGYGNIDLEVKPEYIEDIHNSRLNIYDIGDKSYNELIELIDDSDIIFWNGSLGVIEHDYYKKSSINLVNYLKSKTSIQVIIGGGETGSLIEDKNNINSNIFISTGGGALLEFIQEKLNNNKNIIGLSIYQ